MILNEQSPITYKEYVEQYETGDNKVISDLTGDALNETIYDWYKYRYLSFVDTDKFRDILRRTISVSMPRYEQLLRIEPGVSEYDWLVGMYRERQLKKTSEGKVDTTHDNDTISSTSGIHSHNDHDEWNTGDSNTHGTLKKGKIERTKNGSMDLTHSGGFTDTKTGGHTISGYEGKNTSTYSPHVQKVTQNGGTKQAWSGDQGVAANLPMSETYSDFIEPEEPGTGAAEDKEYYRHAYQHMPALNWKYPSSQTQSGHREYFKDGISVTESFKYDDAIKANAKGDVTVTEGDENNPSKQTIIYDGKLDNDKKGEVNTRDYKNDKISHTFNDYKDTTEQTNADDKWETGSSSNHKNGTGNNDTNMNGQIDKMYGKISSTNSGNVVDREQVTGRNEDPATILMRAANFIRHTNAFEWLRHEIEPCFLALYDID